MHLLFILLTVGASTSAISLKKLASECTGLFKKNEIFSEPITNTVFFTNEAEFDTFYKKVVSITREEVGNTLIDTVEPFLTMYKDFKAKKDVSFNSFYNSYLPDYPPPGDDGITTLLRIFEKIKKLDRSVESSLVLGPIHKNVDIELMKKSLEGNIKPGVPLPEKLFRFDGIVGIIRISIKGKHGVILIDLNYPQCPTHVVMNSPTYAYLNTICVEKVNGNDDKKITFTHFNNYVAYNIFKSYDYDPIVYTPDYGYKHQSNDLLYIARSLSSIANTVEKKALLQPFKGFEKYTKEGEIVAFIFLDVRSNDVKLYTDTQDEKYNKFKTFPVKNKNAIAIPWESLTKDTLTELEESYFNDVSTRLGLDSNILKEKLAKFYTILNSGDSKIKEAFFK